MEPLQVRYHADIGGASIPLAWSTLGYLHSDDCLQADVATNEANGFTELDSGIPGSPGWVQAGYVVSPPIAAVGDILSGLDHHNQIISGAVGENGVVLGEIKRLLAGAAG